MINAIVTIILVVLILNGYVLLLFSINYLVLLLVNARGLVLGEDWLAACLASCGASNRHEASLAVVFPELRCRRHLLVPLLTMLHDCHMLLLLLLLANRRDYLLHRVIHQLGRPLALIICLLLNHLNLRRALVEFLTQDGRLLLLHLFGDLDHLFRHLVTFGRGCVLLLLGGMMGFGIHHLVGNPR